MSPIFVLTQQGIQLVFADEVSVCDYPFSN